VWLVGFISGFWRGVLGLGCVCVVLGNRVLVGLCCGGWVLCELCWRDVEGGLGGGWLVGGWRWGLGWGGFY